MVTAPSPLSSSVVASVPVSGSSVSWMLDRSDEQLRPVADDLSGMQTRPSTQSLASSQAPPAATRLAELLHALSTARAVKQAPSAADTQTTRAAAREGRGKRMGPEGSGLTRRREAFAMRMQPLYDLRAMAESKESSVLFSLKELMNLEEDRVKQEADAKTRAAQAEVQARLDAERRVRDEEEARLRAADDARRAEEQRQREEAARHEAIRVAEVERARLDAENRARLEAMRHQQEHEQRVAAISQQSGKKQATLIAAGIGAVLFIALVGGGLFIKKQNDESAAQAAAAEAQRQDLQNQIDAAKAEADKQAAAVKAATSALSSAKDDAARAQAQHDLDIAMQKQNAANAAINRVRAGGAVKAGGGTTPAAGPCTCSKMDPLCGCIQ